jgi:hypothetical protein
VICDIVRGIREHKRPLALKSYVVGYAPSLPSVQHWAMSGSKHGGMYHAAYRWWPSRQPCVAAPYPSTWLTAPSREAALATSAWPHRWQEHTVPGVHPLVKSMRRPHPNREGMNYRRPTEWQSEQGWRTVIRLGQSKTRTGGRPLIPPTCAWRRVCCHAVHEQADRGQQRTAPCAATAVHGR